MLKHHQAHGISAKQVYRIIRKIDSMEPLRTHPDFTPCWNWDGCFTVSRNRKYHTPRVIRNGKAMNPAYILHAWYKNEPIPEKMQRTCGNSSCVNPNHFRVRQTGRESLVIHRPQNIHHIEETAKEVKDLYNRVKSAKPQDIDWLLDEILRVLLSDHPQLNWANLVLHYGENERAYYDGEQAFISRSEPVTSYAGLPSEEIRERLGDEDLESLFDIWVTKLWKGKLQYLNEPCPNPITWDYFLKVADHELRYDLPGVETRKDLWLPYIQAMSKQFYPAPGYKELQFKNLLEEV